MKQRKNLKIVLIIIGIILISLAIRSIYISYKIDKAYEEKGYETISAVCTEENSYIRNSNR